MGYLIHFEDEEALNAQVVGQKFYALAKVFRAGFAVPKAVAVSTEAHQHYLSNNRWPDGLAEDVLKAAIALEISQGLSIRSSATREDLEKQSFAGQYRSFLQVVDMEVLKHNIEQCWKSVTSKTVQSYLKSSNLPVDNDKTPLMAVVIQKMVNARAAGIAFGRNPMKPARKEILIEAVQGLAEDLVSGHRTPYRAVVNENGRVKVTPPSSKSRDADEKDHLLDFHPFWREIAQLVKNLEFYNGEKPLDIEWAVDNRKKIWLLQSRTITTLSDTATRIPPGIWTRKIANDLWADRLTPFLAHHMAKNASRFDLSRVLKMLGIPVIRPTLTTIEGYLYINGESIIKGIAYLPLKLRLPDIDSLLPSSIEAGRLPGPSLGTLFSVCIRGLLLPIMEPRVNPFICLKLAKHDLKVINRQIDRVSSLPDKSPRLTMDKVQATLETLARLQIKNQWPYFFATFTTWSLHWLVVHGLGLSHTDFLNLLSENANNISVNIEQNFQKIAQKIAQHEDLADHFLHMSVDDLAKDPPSAISSDLKNFLAKYGCRSRHRTLFIKRWAESPQEVIGILQSLVRNQQLDSTEELNERRLSTPASGKTLPPESINEGQPSRVAGKSATASLGGSAFDRFSMRLMIRMTRRFLDLREELRFALDRVLYLIRQTLLTLGEQTGLGDKVMFLTAGELNDIVMGKLSCMAAKRRAANRYEEFLRPFDVATFYNEGMVENEIQSNSQLIRGIGTSPGRVRGRAKIVDDPSRSDIQKGDILIAKNTDPGWTPILSIIGGMVMEEGGLLNHCSIVARELGVPSIVGVHQATRRIKDNDLITIDGGLGVVKFED